MFSRSNGSWSHMEMKSPECSISFAFCSSVSLCGTNRDTGSSPGELSEELVTQEKRKYGWRMNCDVGEATEGLENEL